MAETLTSPNPFPGLRPFKREESQLFFGRDGQIEHLIDELARTRFLAVVGTSGSGKSSLVLAGLLPSLFCGFMTSAGSNWRVAVLRPGNDPLGSLAAAINTRAVFGSEDSEKSDLQIALTEATLRRGNRGLFETVRQRKMPENENLLVLVDQFEELFRFAREALRHTRQEGERYQNDAAAFVKLLLEARAQREESVYVVLTMRSDFLGDCSQFWDLPEAINESQYLIPRLTRDQLRETITGPIAVGQGEITSRLVNRLLNDVGEDQDQLPVLQHLLMRMWDESRDRRLDVECDDGVTRTHREVHSGAAIDLCCYAAVGGIDQALSRHADEAFTELPDQRHRVISEKMFKCLTEKGEDNREIRRPVTLAELCTVSRTDVDEPIEDAVKTIVETFRVAGRSFLMPPLPTKLESNSLIDISHESLIRGWNKLKTWVEEESQSARMYQRLTETLTLYRMGEHALMRDPELQLALDWCEKNNPNQYWAARYHGDFNEAMNFLSNSVAARNAEVLALERQRRKGIRRTRFTAVVFALLFLVSLLAWIFAYRQTIGLVRANSTTLRSLEIATSALDRNRRLLYDLNINFAYREANQDRLWVVPHLLDESYEDFRDLRGFEWYYLWRLAHKERATLRGHSASVSSVAFSPDGKILATGSYDKTVKLWDTATNSELAMLVGHSAVVTAVAFSPDGKFLATGSYDKTVKLWNTATNSELAMLVGHSAAVTAVAFSPDGKIFASGSGETVKLWDTATNSELAMLVGHSAAVTAVAFSPDGKILASGSGDTTVKLWNTATRTALATLTGHSESVSSLAFSPEGKTLATGSYDKTVKLWNTVTTRELTTLRGHRDEVYSVAFSPDGKILTSSGGYDRMLQLWDMTTHKTLATLTGHSNSVSSVAFSPDGRTIATGSEDNSVKLWDAATHEDSTTLANTAEVYAAVFSPDGAIIAIGGEDRNVTLYEAATRKKLATLAGHSDSISFITFSSDGKVLASSSRDGTVKLWDPRIPKELTTFNGHSDSVNSVAFSPDGKTLATASSDNTVKLWDLIAHKELITLTGHSGDVYAIAFTPDGQILASGSEDRTAKLWSVTTHKELATLTGHNYLVGSLAFSPDGKILATGSWDYSVKLWDVATHRVLATIQGHLNSINSIGFSPDRKTLATASSDKTVKLWDLITFKELATLSGHKGEVNSVAFSSNGKTLATSSDDRTVRLWIAANEEAVSAQSK